MFYHGQNISQKRDYNIDKQNAYVFNFYTLNIFKLYLENKFLSKALHCKIYKYIYTEYYLLAYIWKVWWVTGVTVLIQQ